MAWKASPEMYDQLLPHLAIIFELSKKCDKIPEFEKSFQQIKNLSCNYPGILSLDLKK